MTPAILLLTSSLYNQQASNSQTRFESMEICEDARLRRLAQEPDA
jgi:hypothetical protein